MKKYLPQIILVLLTFVVYLNALPGKFVWDDEDNIYKNVYVRNVCRWPESLDKNFIAGAGKTSNYYRPLSLLSFGIDWAIWGNEPSGFHLTNIGLHAGATILLYLFMLHLLKDTSTSFLTAGFFAVHPLQTEAVTYISGRGDPLFALLMFGACILYLRSKNYDLHDRNYLYSILLFIAALLTKEVAIIALPLLALIEWFRQKYRPKVLAILALKRLWPYGVIAGIYILLRLTVLNFTNTLNFYNAGNIYADSLLIRLYTFTSVLLIYLKLLLYPHPLYMERSVVLVTRFFSVPVLLVLTGILVYLGIWYRYFRKNKLPLFALGWFFISLAPTSGIIPINGIIYEHFLYTALIGPFLLIAKIFSYFYHRYPDKKKLVIGTLALWWFVLGVRTIVRNQDWRTPITFYNQLLRHSESARVHNNLAMAYAEQQKYQQALTHYQRALELSEAYPQVYHNLGRTWAALGKPKEASASFRRAIDSAPGFQPAYLELIQLYIQYRQFDSAEKTVRQMERALKINSGVTEKYLQTIENLRRQDK